MNKLYTFWKHIQAVHVLKSWFGITIFFSAVIFLDIDIFYNEKVMLSYFLCMNCGTRTIFKICYVSQLLFKIKKAARVRVWWTKNALFFAPCTFEKKNKTCKVKINKRFLVINEIKHHNRRSTKYLVKLLSQTKTKMLHAPWTFFFWWVICRREFHFLKKFKCCTGFENVYTLYMFWNIDLDSVFFLVRCIPPPPLPPPLPFCLPPSQ